MIGRKVKFQGFARIGVVKATRKEGGEVHEVLVQWGDGNLRWEQLGTGRIEVLQPEVPDEKTG